MTQYPSDWTWLDIIPALPIEDGLPLQRRKYVCLPGWERGQRYLAVAPALLLVHEGEWALWDRDRLGGLLGVGVIPADELFIDLEDDRGFAYGLWLLTSVPENFDHLTRALGDVDVEWAVEWATALALGHVKPSDADRRALAIALHVAFSVEKK